MNPRLSSLGLAAMVLAAAACGKGASTSSLPSFQDVQSAPAAIQKAARAVVRIQTAGESATGSFISADGLLLTNNHVLGVDVCPIEGCYPKLSFLHQRGQPSSRPVGVYVVPVAVDVGLDMALVQVYASKGGGKLPTSDYLNLVSRTPAQLMTTHVTVVGHPQADLKKTTTGEVIDTDGEWVWTSAYSLPGDSGSPFLDDAGDLVGILHRGPTSESLLTTTGANEYCIGTASSALMAAMKAPLPSAMISVLAPAVAADVVTNNLLYLNAQVSTVPQADGSTLDIPTALGSACDTGLARTDYASPEDLSSALAPCGDATEWFECRVDATPTLGQSCPSPADASTWGARYQAMNDHWRALNGELDLYHLSFGAAALTMSEATGVSVGGSNVLAALTAAGQPVDHQVAYYLSAFNVPSYAGTSPLAFVQNYRSEPDYALGLDDFGSAATWLTSYGAMSQDALQDYLGKLMADPALDVGDRLDIEELQYDWGFVQ